MSIFDYFFKKTSSESANVAQERLRFVVAHHRRKNQGEEDSILNQIKQDILQVLARYYPQADFSDIHIHTDKKGDDAVLQIDLTIPEKEAVDAG